MEITDVQIALIIKNALEYNAAIIAHASQLFGMELSPKQRQQATKNFQRITAQYNDNLVSVLEQPNVPPTE